MGKYILEVILIGCLVVFIAPFVLGGVRMLKKQYTRSLEKTIADAEKEKDDAETS